MEKAFCPHCKKEINLNKVIKKFFGGKSKSDTSVISKIAAGVMAPGSVAYLCPECRSILGIGQ